MRIHKSPIRTCRVLLSIAFVMVLAGCAGYVPGRQAYWDEQVDRMCEADGGTRIFEVMELPPHQYRLLLNRYGKLDVPGDDDDSRDVPVTRTEQTAIIHDANPRVWKYTLNVVRKSDRRILGTQVIYARVGGDFHSPAHESSYSCPKQSPNLFAATVKQRREAK